MDLELEDLCLALGEVASRALGGDAESKGEARSELRLLLDRASELRHQLTDAAPAEMRQLLAVVLAAEDAWVKLEKRHAS